VTVSNHDVVIVGGGPGGYVAAIRAAQLGLSVALVERAELGGVCLNWGCIPTKALLHAADLLREIRHADNFGIDVAPPRIDLDVMVTRSRRVAGQLSDGIGHLMRKHRVPVHRGDAHLAAMDRVQVALHDGGGETLEAETIVLATGTRPKNLPNITADGKFVWTAREAMTPRRLPRHLLVIGAGAIGIEFASFYRDLGCAVTVVEVLPQILPSEDTEIANLVQQALRQRGIDIHTEATVTELVQERAQVRTSNGEIELDCDQVILAVGVTGNTENLGLEDTGVVIDRGFITTNAFCQTAEPTIYAIGDVAGPPCLAHKASHEGVIAIEQIAGEPVHALMRTRIPACTYAYPQVASVGLTERAAVAAGRSTRIGRFPLIGNGKAAALGDTQGLIKTIFDAETGELLGAHLVGPGVTELIAGYVIAMNAEATEAELIHSVFPHPTLSEALHESVLAAYDRVLHV
jgi:dihydrolipoamide dehydrogenase